MTSFLQDLSQGFRALTKRPGFTGVAVLTLALGIGANTAIFSVADVLLFRPVLLNDLDRLVVAYGTRINRPNDYNNISPADFISWREQNTTLEGLSTWDDWGANFTGTGDPEQVRGYVVSANFFRVLGASPMIGRTFLPEEDKAGRDRVVILSYGLWKRRFGGDPEIVRRTLQLDGREFQIIGVMNEDFRYPPPAELWAPLVLPPNARQLRGSFYLQTVARLKPGISVTQASSQIEGLALRDAKDYPETHSKRSARVELLREHISGSLTRDYTRMLLGAVAFVLLIACANVANLQFARVSTRSKEMAIRTALGSSRWRIIRLHLMESILLGIGGSLLGLVLAFWGIRLIRGGMPAEVEIFLPGWQRMGINGLSLAFTMAASLISGILAGLAPAFAGSRVELIETLKESHKTVAPARQRLKSTLVVAEIIVALILLVGAGLMVQGFRVVADPIPNLAPSRVLTLEINLPESRYAGAVELKSFQDRALEHLSTLPEVQSVGFVSTMPYSGSSRSSSFTITGRAAPMPGETPVALLQSVSTDYFKAARIPLHRGRGFTEQDGPESERTVIVTETLVKQYFPSEDPIGKRVKLGLINSSESGMTIVGVAADVLQNWTDRVPRPTIYRPMGQAPLRSFHVLLRTLREPLIIASAVRAKILEVDRDQPISGVKTFEKVISDQLVGLAYVAVLMAFFGVLALILATVGIYSIMAYSVSQRTHELGIRMAIGAGRSDVLKMVIGEGLRITLIGLVLGLAASYWMARMLASVVFGINPTDPLTLLALAGLLAATSVVACYIPARRATRVDPMVALRYE